MELVVRNGQFMTVGDDSAEFFHLRKGDIVFNAEQTRQIFANGKILNGAKRGVSYVSGSAYDSGSGGRRRSSYTSVTSSSSASTTSSAGTTKKSSSAKTSSAKTSSPSDEKDELKKFDWVEIAISRLNKLIDSLEKTADSAYLVISKRLSAASDEISEVTKMISLQEQAYNRYLQEANAVGLSSDLMEKVKNGVIDINEYDSDTQDLIKEFQDWYEKCLDCSDALDDLSEQLGDLYKQKFKINADEFESQIDLIKHLLNTYETGLDILEEKGLFASSEYYTASINSQKQTAEILNKELKSLTQAMSDAVNAGAIEQGSEAFNDMQKEINDVKEAIQDTELKILKLNNSIRKLEWEKFDYTLDRIEQINKEAKFFVDLMSHEKLFDDAGNATGQGIATFGMYGQQYNVLMEQADLYKSEMLIVQKELAKDPYNQQLIDRYEDLREAQQKCILSAEDMKDSVKDLVEDGYDIQLKSLKELIDNYNDLNNSQKDLYDYQKKISKQTKEIATLQKQLAALSGDESQETKLKVQKIKVDLEDALEDLKETEDNYLITEQKKMLDDLYNEYETILNERLDNVDALFDAVITNINERSLEVNSTISSEAKEVGYTISDSMKDIWSNQALTTLSTYHNDFLIQFTAVTDVLNKIAANTTKAEAKADTTAKATVSATTSTTKVTAPAKTTTVTTTKKPEPAKVETPKAVTVGQRVKVDPNTPIYINSLGQVGKWGSHQYFYKDPIYYVVKENNGYVAVRHHTQTATAGWFKKSQVTAFKSGGLADFTGPAWLDGSKSRPEAVLNPEMTKAFLEFTNSLRETRSSSLTYEKMNNSVKDIAGTNFGDINVNVAIDHVQDYNDFAAQLQNDPKFERLVQDMTIGRMTGGSSLSKYRHYK